MKKLLIVSLLLFIITGFVTAENLIELKKASLEWGLDGDELTISLKAETKGWIAVGLGSSRMDGSAIFIGYNKDGEAFFEEHLGKGHGHQKTDIQRPVVYEVEETDGVTTVKFTVLKSDFTGSGASKLPVIVAYGARDNFTSMHRYRDSTVISF